MAIGDVLSESTVTAMLLLAVLAAPSSSVTVSVAVYVPALAYACATVAPDPLDPSPKLHA